jgi:hypothetical protein
MPWRCIAVSLLLLAGCKQTDPSVCRRQAEELGTFLSTMDHDVVVPASHNLQIRAGTIELEDKPVVDAELRDRLAERQARSKAPLHILIDETTPWERVVMALTSAHTVGITKPILVFPRPPKGSPPPPSAADAELDAALAANKDGVATAFASYLEKLAARCPQLIEVFGEVAAHQGRDRATHMLSSMGPAVGECGCKVDIPRLRTTMWRFVGNPNPTTSLELEVVPDGKVIELPATTPWREASRSFSPGTRRIWPASR